MCFNKLIYCQFSYFWLTCVILSPVCVIFLHDHFLHWKLICNTYKIQEDNIFQGPFKNVGLGHPLCQFRLFYQTLGKRLIWRKELQVSCLAIFSVFVYGEGYLRIVLRLFFLLRKDIYICNPLLQFGLLLRSFYKADHESTCQSATETRVYGFKNIGWNLKKNQRMNP